MHLREVDKVCFSDSISLRSPRRLSLVITSPHLMFTMGKLVKVGICEGRFLLQVVSEWVVLSLGKL